MKKYATIAFSLACRVLQVGSSLFVVRYLVSMLGVENYGVWVTLVSVLAWMSLFDFGIGYGVKNRISEYSATGRKHELRRMVSVAVVFYVSASALLFLVFAGGGLLLQPFAQYFGPSILLFIGASLAFLFSLGGVVLQGLGRFKMFYALNLLQPLLWFLLVMQSRHEKWSLAWTANIYTLAMVAQAGLIMFLGIRSAGGMEWLGLRVSFREIKPMLKTGLGFLFLQLANLALFMSGNFIIYNSLGAVDVATYDILNKIFQFFSIGFSIVINIAWTEISKAKACGDHAKKKQIFVFLVSLAVLSSLVALVFAYHSNPISSLLTKGRVVAASSVAIHFVPLVLVQGLAYSGAVFLNAYEELRVQNFLSIAAVPMFLLLSQAFLHAQVRQASIPLASALAILPSMAYCLYRGYFLAIGSSRNEGKCV